MNPVLQVTNLGKSYRKWRNEWYRIASWFSPSIKPDAEHWVLKDVSFSVNPGEAVGIIGKNGAGKSTLLKLIVGTTRPTQGAINLQGSVSAILELGMGFNLELTGRQNAYHSAGLMGHSQSDIIRVMPDIEAFAEIGEYFDQPVRTYSSGMQMRVAFSVATAIRPSLLIIDEALSVGDIYFQQKCFRRIREYSASGTTLLFVTHDIVGVLETCSRAIYLRNGAMVIDAAPHVAVGLYQADLMGHPEKNQTKVIDNISQNKETVVAGEGDLVTAEVSCLSVVIEDETGKSTLTIVSGHLATLVIKYKANCDLKDPHVGFKIHNRLGAVIFETNTFCMQKSLGAVEQGSEIEVRYCFPIDLAPGEYTITVGLANDGFDKCEFKERLSYLSSILAFAVLPNEHEIIWSGIINIHPNVNWKILAAVDYVL